MAGRDVYVFCFALNRGTEDRELGVLAEALSSLVFEVTLPSRLFMMTFGWGASIRFGPPAELEQRLLNWDRIDTGCGAVPWNRLYYGMC